MVTVVNKGTVYFVFRIQNIASRLFKKKDFKYCLLTFLIFANFDGVPLNGTWNTVFRVHISVILGYVVESILNN